MENLLCGPAGLRPAVEGLAAQVSRSEDIDRAFELLDAVGLCRPSPTSAPTPLRRPAPARRHRARGDAAARSCCSPTSRPPRSTRRPRSRSWNCMRELGREPRHPGDRQHARRGAGAALRRPHRRHVGRHDRLRRPAGGLDRRRTSSRSTAARTGCSEQRRPRTPAPFRPTGGRASGWLALAAYVVYAAGRLDFTLGALRRRPGQRRRASSAACSRRVIAQPDSLPNGLLEIAADRGPRLLPGHR